ncbi:YIP1 family protein [Paracoccus aerodenitrificans]|uniref:YIP1 family protein n=1 Tax=Paracoccus aerodenitrificans TaxID=3017781 RepID=UPI0022F040D8|nr:YIP1 family protein [Paracoccus aerodenitrificans]WBU64651.1 YIP1 family protein [Paracoccus aerodenitrificans]
MTFHDLKILARNSLQNPPLALRQLQSLDLPVPARWMALALAVALSSILAVFAVRLMPAPMEAGLDAAMGQPLKIAFMQMIWMSLMAWLMATVGRGFGGRGSFADAVLVVAWLELLLCVVQAAQVLLMLIFPLVASLLGFAGLFIYLWLSVQFIKALHGFRSGAIVFFAVVVTSIFALIFLSVMAGAFGLLPETPAEVQP